MIYGSAPTGPVTLALLVAASNLPDKSAPHSMQSFCGYVHELPSPVVSLTSDGVKDPTYGYMIQINIGTPGIEHKAVTVNYTMNGTPYTKSIGTGTWIIGWYEALDDNTGTYTFQLQSGTDYTIGSPDYVDIETGSIIVTPIMNLEYTNYYSNDPYGDGVSVDVVFKVDTPFTVDTYFEYYHYDPIGGTSIQDFFFPADSYDCIIPYTLNIDSGAHEFYLAPAASADYTVGVDYPTTMIVDTSSLYEGTGVSDGAISYA